MAVSRNQCKQFIIQYIADSVSVPSSWITETTDLKGSLLYDNNKYIELTKAINIAQWHSAYFLPGELNNCATPKEIIDLLYQKIKNG